MQSVLPQNLNYQDVKPVGYPSHVRQEKFTPIAFNNQQSAVGSSDIIRFNISTNGFWDPYSAYIKLEVDVTGMDGTFSTSGLACGSLQVDNSASSFINQLIVYKGGTEIERIEEYDTLLAILNDMNGDLNSNNSRQVEGCNSQIVTGGYGYSNPSIIAASLQFGWSPLGLQLPNQSLANYQGSLSGAYTGSSQRYECQIHQCDGKDTLQSTTNSNYLFRNQTVTAPLGAFGYMTPFCQSLSNFANETLLTKNFDNFTTYKGALGQYVRTDRQTFCIPLASGLLGVLMPKDSYKYIPMKALQELILEFRLSPYAMFTSGYADGATVANNAGNALLALGTTTNPMLSRIWKITKFELNVEMQYFESQVEDIILSQLKTERGIVLHSNSWMLGPRYQIAGFSSPNGTYQVNLGFESLKNVIFCFIPDDFTTYTFCRKQFRVSANITSMYLKVGNEYFPPLPITGHAGNPNGFSSINNDFDAGNAEFIISLYKTFGKFHDRQQNCAINPINFAVNNRPYNPTNTSAYSNGTTFTNLDTAMSQSLFHENRCVGKAVYAMNLETLNQDFSVISGLNTIKNTPFEITIKSDSVNSFPRPYTMYTFCQYDMLVQLRNTGVQVLGRG